ncbi:phospholipase DDHD1-like [Watersipora subatra]|uniref:phospholipase DDHD1-like n=1 Tax=Watersipora subatra TaxID=2589382 RepID=UPI00355C2FAC
MFKTVGEASEFDGKSFEDDSKDFSMDGFEEGAQGNMPTSSAACNFDSFESSDSPKVTRKMFWHAARIDVVQDLVPEQVRWFYKEDPKAKWVPFLGYDSLRIECRYRALEYARDRSNSLDEEDVDSRIHVRGGLYEVDINNNVLLPIYWKGQSLPILRGTWFIDGTFQPLEYDYSLQLESDHLAKFKGQSIPEPVSAERKTGLPRVLHNVRFPEFHVDWYDVDEFYMFSEAASSRMYRYVTNKLSIQKPGTGTRLYRGYAEEAKMEEKQPDVTQLVFVVHGMGQKYNQNKIISCCNDLRNKADKLLPKYFPDLTAANQRIEFLPVEWRSDLQLDGDLVESITPEMLRNLRVILNSTAMDILYYTSPLYRGEIINGLISELTRLYMLFLVRHPYFEANNGQVSICAHSLGSVILYDILTGWDPIELYDQYVCKTLQREKSHVNIQENESTQNSMTSGERSKRLHDFYINSIVQKEKTPLPFKVSNVFSLGSPLGVFLTLRGIRPKANGLMDHILPKRLCKRFYNVYHPSDPVAYRIEPLILKHYSSIAPLKIHKISEPKKTPYGQMKAMAYTSIRKATTPRKRAKNEQHASPEKSRDSDLRETESGEIPAATSSLPTASLEHDNRKASGLTGAVKGFFNRFGGKRQPAEVKLAAELEDYALVTSEDEMEERGRVDAATVEQTDLEYRLDFVLPSGSMTNNYVSAIFSHTSYWSNPEIALFLLTHIFPDYGPVK